MKLGLFPFLVYFAQGIEHKKCRSLRDKKTFYEGQVLEAFLVLMEFYGP